MHQVCAAQHTPPTILLFFSSFCASQNGVSSSTALRGKSWNHSVTKREQESMLLGGSKLKEGPLMVALSWNIPALWRWRMGQELRPSLHVSKQRITTLILQELRERGGLWKPYLPQNHNLGHCKSPLKGSKQLPSLQSNAACSSS